MFTDARPGSPTQEEREREKVKKHSRAGERKVIVTGDTDLLLKHLFAGVVDEKKTTTTNTNNAAHLRRGRYVNYLSYCSDQLIE